MTSQSPARLTLKVDPGGNLQPEEVDRLTRQLLAELGDLDVESVELVREGDLPAGAKSAEAITLGALWITVLPTVIPKLIDFVQSWSLRGSDRTVRIKANVGDRSLEVEYTPGVTSEAQLQDLVHGLTSALGSDTSARKTAG